MAKYVFLLYNGTTIKYCFTDIQIAITKAFEEKLVLHRLRISDDGSVTTMILT